MGKFSLDAFDIREVDKRESVAAAENWKNTLDDNDDYEKKYTRKIDNKATHSVKIGKRSTGYTVKATEFSSGALLVCDAALEQEKAIGAISEIMEVINNTES